MLVLTLSCGLVALPARCFVSSQPEERNSIAVQVDQPVEVDHHSHQNQHDPCADFNLAKMRLQPLQELAESVKTEAEQQKWDAHAERVEQQKQDPLSKCSSRGGQAEDGAEQKANTGCPANGKDNTAPHCGPLCRLAA